jgi:glycosyltransferase involved in cell wall biosynthesis
MTSRRLRVAILTTDNLRGYSGIDRYTNSLLQGLDQVDDLDVVPVVSASDAAWLRESLPGVSGVITTRVIGGVFRNIEERYWLNRKLREARVDIVHGTKHILPWRPSLPTVLTVHDLFPLTRAADYRWSKRLLLPIAYRQAIAQADRLIVMTASNRSQLVHGGFVDESRVDVVPAAAALALSSATPEAVGALDGRSFALCVGDLSPRKNVDLLLRIWPSVQRETGLTLALVGPDRTRSEEIRDRLAELDRQGVIVRVGGARDGALRWCYENARVVLIPSLEEGCGLPAIEAVYFGADLVTSRDPALVEVGGSGARHVDAQDEAGWKLAIASASESESPMARSDSAPTWRRIAEGTAAVYRRATQSGE